jgi:hypothetical protein
MQKLEFLTDFSAMPQDVPLLFKPRARNRVPFIGVAESANCINRALEYNVDGDYVYVEEMEGWFPLMEAFGLLEQLSPFWRESITYLPDEN